MRKSKYVPTIAPDELKRRYDRIVPIATIDAGFHTAQAVFFRKVA